jgi:hypothetical protein
VVSWHKFREISCQTASKGEFLRRRSWSSFAGTWLTKSPIALPLDSAYISSREKIKYPAIKGADMATLVEKLKEFEANSIWIGKHYQELKAKYPDEYVAVWKEEVVGHGKDMPSLLEILKKQYPEDHSHIPVEFIGSEDVILILSYA